MLNTECKIYKTANASLYGILRILPPPLLSEIERLGESRKDFPHGISEIRVKSPGRSSIVISGESIPLFYKLCERELKELFDKVIGGSLYAHTRDLSRGFVSLDGGVRVGVCGTLSDSKQTLGRVCGLVFRIPFIKCSYESELVEIWESATRGMLIYSLPGAGKTSALRAMAAAINRKTLKRIVVVDEKCEFIPEDYSDLSVDILSGYQKSKGIEIALRALGPELIIIDEIASADETEALLRVGRGGVPIIATAHAATFSELIRKEAIAPLVKEGYFDRYVRLYCEGSRFGFEVS